MRPIISARSGPAWSSEAFRAAYELVHRALSGPLPPGWASARALRVWVPACGDGAAAYAAACAVLELLGRRRTALRVIGSDADPGRIARARCARPPYDALAWRRGGLGLARRARAACLFSEHSLLDQAPFPGIDLAVAASADCAPGASRIHQGLREGGLLVASAECLRGLAPGLFRTLDSSRGLLVKEPRAAPGFRERRAAPRVEREAEAERARAGRGRRGGVLVDARLRLVRALPGSASFFVDALAPGEPVLASARPSLRPALQVLLARAAAGEPAETLRESFTLFDLGRRERLTLSAVRLPGRGGRGPYFWLLIDPETGEPAAGALSGSEAESIARQREELSRMTDRLARTIAAYRLVTARERDAVRAADERGAALIPESGSARAELPRVGRA